MANNFPSWPKLFAMISIDNEEFYQDLVGTKCNRTKIYSNENIESLEDSFTSPYVPSVFGEVSSYINKQHKYYEEFPVVDDDEEDEEFIELSVTRKNLFAHLF